MLNDKIELIISSIKAIKNDLSKINPNANLKLYSKSEIEVYRSKIKAKVSYEDYKLEFVQSFELADLLQLWLHNKNTEFNDKLKFIIDLMVLLFPESERDKKYTSDFDFTIMTSLRYTQSIEEFIKLTTNLTQSDQVKLFFNGISEMLDDNIQNAQARKELENFRASREYQNEQAWEAKIDPEKIILCPVCDSNPCICSDPDRG